MRTTHLLAVSQHALHIGVSARGVSAWGDVCLRGVYTGKCLPRGVSAQEVSAQEGCLHKGETPPCEQNDRQG